MRYVSIRVGYVLRSFGPHGFAGGIVLLIFWSIKADDLAGLKEVAWSKLLRFDRKALPSFDWWIEQFASSSCVSKALLVALSLVAAWYFSDLASTGRKVGWQLVSKYGSTSRWDGLKVWASLVFGVFAVTTVAMALVYTEFCSSITAFKFVLVTDLIVLAAAMWLNRTFEGFQLLVPELEEKRDRRRQERKSRSEECRRQHQLREQRRAELRDIQQQIAEKEQQIEAANREIRKLVESDHDAQLVEETVSNLERQKADLNSQIARLAEAIPARV